MSPYTAIQVCDDTVQTSGSRSRAFAVGIAACAVGALCVAAVPRASATQQYASGATMTARGPALTMAGSSVVSGPRVNYYPSNVRVHAYADAMEDAAAPVSNFEPVAYTTAPQSTNVFAVFGGLFMFMGAAVVLVQKMFAPRQESWALLPTSGAVDDEIFTFHNIRSNPGSRKKKTRKGRGHGAGQGGSCGFGNRGQKSRSGPGPRQGFEGGQIPLYRASPKLVGRPMGPGHRRTVYLMKSIKTLANAEEGSTLTFEDRTGAKPVLFKIGGLREGDECTVPANLTVKAHAFTETARAAIEGAGGKCVVMNKYGRVLGEEAEAEDSEADSEAEEVAMMAMTSEVYNDDSVVYYDDTEGEVDLDVASSTVAMAAMTAQRTAKVGKYNEPNPRTANLPEAKKENVAQVNELLQNSVLVFGFDCAGLTVKELKELRLAMPGSTKIQIVKNTLFRIAARGTQFEEMDPITMGQKAWVFVQEDDMQDTIKNFQAYIKDNKKEETNAIAGGAMESSFLSGTQVVSVGDMPSKKELIEKIARLIKMVTTKVAVGVKAVPKKVSIAIRLATVEDQDGWEEALEEAQKMYKTPKDDEEAAAEEPAPEAEA